jgi:hypothetical protein
LEHWSIAALQQMKNTWNEVSNDILSYSWQCSDLEMFIPSWNILYEHFHWFHFEFWDSAGKSHRIVPIFLSFMLIVRCLLFPNGKKIPMRDWFNWILIISSRYNFALRYEWKYHSFDKTAIHWSSSSSEKKVASSRPSQFDSHEKSISRPNKCNSESCYINMFIGYYILECAWPFRPKWKSGPKALCRPSTETKVSIFDHEHSKPICWVFWVLAQSFL